MVKYFNPKSLERLSRFHKLIQKEITGTPRELANKFNISERNIYLMIDWLKDYGATIKYDRKRKTYFYPKAFELKIRFYIKSIIDDEMRIIEGGKIYSTARILQGKTFSLPQY